MNRAALYSQVKRRDVLLSLGTGEIAEAFGAHKPPTQRKALATFVLLWFWQHPLAMRLKLWPRTFGVISLLASEYQSAM